MKIKMVIFDMDGVLVDIDSSWQFIHRAFGVSNEENFRDFLNGKIDYAEFMRRDIRLWGNVHINIVKEILAKAPLMKGAKSTIAELREAGFKTAILSAGISVLAERLQAELGIEYALANGLLVDEKGMLSGEGEEVVNLLNKATALRKLVLERQITPRCCAVVADSVFDIPLFKEVGFGIAFKAGDERVREAADIVINRKDLRQILSYLWNYSPKSRRT